MNTEQTLAAMSALVLQQQDLKRQLADALRARALRPLKDQMLRLTNAAGIDDPFCPRTGMLSEETLSAIESRLRSEQPAPSRHTWIGDEPESERLDALKELVTLRYLYGVKSMCSSAKGCVQRAIEALGGIELAKETPEAAYDRLGLGESSTAPPVEYEAHGPSGGAVESEHGPCEDGGTPVRDLLWMIDLQDKQRAFIEARLAHGEKPENYGKPLREGWTRARAALEEELADGIVYALAAQEEEIAQSLANAWVQLNATPDSPRCGACKKVLPDGEADGNTCLTCDDDVPF